MKKKVKINLKNVSVNIPIFDVSARSLRNTFVNFTQSQKDENKTIIINALKDINIQISSGDRLGVIGKNGSGKTTFLRVCSGAIKPDIGEVEISGRITSLIDIGFGLEEDATGYENIILKGLYLKRSPKLSKKLFSIIEEISDLGSFLNLPIRTYSSGMRMRLAYAIASAEDPQILIMDEWLSVGDKEWIAKMSEKIDSFVFSSAIFILASHNEELVNKLCNKIIYLDNGNLVGLK